MNAWILAMRPKTLVAAVVPTLLAQGLVVFSSNQSLWSWWILCVLGALGIQVATNFYNDAVDFKKGADTDRVGPRRATAAGDLSYKQMMWAGHFVIACTLVIGIALSYRSGLGILALGLASLYLSYGYTGGPYPLAYKGLGELFVYIFFGQAAVLGTEYVLTDGVSFGGVMLGHMVGLASCALIAVNNYRDRHTDPNVGKNTLATKLNHGAYLGLMDLFWFGPYLSIAYFGIFVDLRFFCCLLPVGFAWKAREVLHDGNEGEGLNAALELSAKHLLFLGLSFYGVCWWAR